MLAFQKEAHNIATLSLLLFIVSDSARNSPMSDMFDSVCGTAISLGGHAVGGQVAGSQAKGNGGAAAAVSVPSCGPSVPAVHQVWTLLIQF